MADETARSSASLAMESYADGDPGAFATVYDELAPRLERYIRRRIVTAEVADDLLQNVFLNMHLARARFVRGASVEPWAYAIAHRLMIDWLRQERRKQSRTMLQLQHQQRHDEAPGWDLEQLATLRRELESVPATLREAFLLVRVEGLTLPEAAEVLGTTATAIKIRAYRATIWLRERLSESP